MRGKPITSKEISQMVTLRQQGRSLTEIMKLTSRGSSTVFKYIHKVKLSDNAVSIIRFKQGGSRKRAKSEWQKASLEAQRIIANIDWRLMSVFILASLYWCEGTKRELNFINSDPGMMRVFLNCLYELGVPRERIKVGLRIHQGINECRAVDFWSDYLEIDPERIKGIEIIPKGRKEGKLMYGICRVRVAKSAAYFKLILSLIEEIKTKYNAPVVQWIE